MAYVAPYIDAAGFHIPSYSDIRDELLEDARSIFGQDLYLDTDSADYQFVSVVSLKVFDALNAAQLAYNNRSPLTAVGTGLDAIVLLNGLQRIPATYSTCQVIVSGTAGTVITNGVIRSSNGYLWDLPVVVTIPAGGSIEVSAVCQTLGAVSADVGMLIYINTPTAGWTSVTNNVMAVTGAAAETDAELRARQAQSVTLPSQTLLQGTKAAILSVSNVNRCEVYENDTNVTTVEGFPPHSITAVVEGGTDSEVATAILYHKGIGGGTNGTTAVTVLDEDLQPYIIRYYRPTYVPIYVEVELVKLPNYQTSLSSQIQSSIVSYLNTLSLGSDVTISSLWGVVMAQMPDLRNPVFSVTSVKAGLSPTTLGTSNIVLTFNIASIASNSTVEIAES